MRGRSRRRRSRWPRATIGVVVFTFGGCEVDLDRVEIRRDGDLEAVQPQVFTVIEYLIAHRDRVVSKEELLDNVWGDRFVGESTLTSRIKSARRALGDTGVAQAIIKTVHGRGYRFVADLDGRPTGSTPAPADGTVDIDTRTRTRTSTPARSFGASTTGPE